MTRYLARVIAGDTPSLEDWNEHVIAFHLAFGAATENLASLLRTAGGETSYDVLANRIKTVAPNARSLLDIGCGDGMLLERLATAFGPDLALTGIDLSAAAIERARAKVPGASLECADADGYAMEREVYDVITAHLSFMAMPRLRAVIGRARDALRPSGRLVFVTEDPLAGDTFVGLMRKAIAALRGRLPKFAPLVPGREPIERDDALRALLADVGLNTHAIERYELRGSFTREQLWVMVQRTYPIGLLDPALREEIREETLASAPPTGRDGLVPIELSVRLVAAG